MWATGSALTPLPAVVAPMDDEALSRAMAALEEELAATRASEASDAAGEDSDG